MRLLLFRTRGDICWLGPWNRTIDPALLLDCKVGVASTGAGSIPLCKLITVAVVISPAVTLVIISLPVEWTFSLSVLSIVLSAGLCIDFFCLSSALELPELLLVLALLCLCLFPFLLCSFELFGALFLDWLLYSSSAILFWSVMYCTIWVIDSFRMCFPQRM